MDQSAIDACMKKIASEISKKFAKQKALSDRLERRILFIIEAVAGKYSTIEQISDDGTITRRTSPYKTGEMHREIKAALSHVDKLRESLDTLLSLDPYLDFHGPVYESMLAERDRILAGVEKTQTREAFLLGLHLRQSWVALAGTRQRLREIEEISRPRQGRPKAFLASTLVMDIQDDLQKARECGHLEFDAEKEEAFVDLVFGAIDKYFPEAKFKRPSEKAIGQYRERREKEYRQSQEQARRLIAESERDRKKT